MDFLSSAPCIIPYSFDKFPGFNLKVDFSKCTSWDISFQAEPKFSLDNECIGLLMRRLSGFTLCKQDVLLFIMRVGIFLIHYFSEIHCKGEIMESKR